MASVSDDTRDGFYRPIPRVCTTIAGLALITGGGGGIWVSDYVEQHLAQAIAQDLSESLDRPVDLGEATSITPTHIRFGPSSIPATASDADSLEADAIVIGFSLLNLWNDGEVPLSVTLVRPDIYLDQNEDGDWLDTDIDVTGDSKFPVQTVRLQSADVQISPMVDGFEVHPKAAQYLARREQHPLESATNGAPAVDEQKLLNAEFTAPSDVHLQGLHASLKRSLIQDAVTFNVRSHSHSNGTVRIKGHIHEGDTEATIQARQLAIAPLTPLLPSALFVTDGFLTGQLSVAQQKGGGIALQGTTTLNHFSAWVEGEPNPLTDTTAQLTFDGQTIHVDQAAVTYGWIPFEVEGSVHLTNGVQLQAKAKAVDVNDFMATFDLSVPVPITGELKTDNLTVTGAFGQTVFAGTVTHDQPVTIDQVAFDSVRTDFTLDKKTDILTLTHTMVTPSVGGTIVGNARIRLGDVDAAVITARAEGISADAIAQTYGLSLNDAALGTLAAQTQVVVTDRGLHTQLDWGLSDGHYPASGRVTTIDDRVVLKDTIIHIGQNVVTATGDLTENRWQATLQTDGVSLASAIPQATGTVAGQVTFSGQTDKMRLSELHAEGDLSVANVHPMLADPMQVNFNWQGDRLHIQQATTPWLEADGWIQPSFTGSAPDITAMALNLSAQDINLADIATHFPFALPIPVVGQSQFSGTLTGTLDAPQVDGQIQLNDFEVGAIAFEPALSGRVQMTPHQGMHLSLAGNHDTLQVSGIPSSVEFVVQTDGAIAQGQLVNQQLTATLQNLPLAVFHQAPGIDPDLNALVSALSGQLSATITGDFRETPHPALTAEVAIAQPMIGTLPRPLRRRHRGDRFTGTLHYRDGRTNLADGNLRFGDSRLHLTGHATDSDVQGQINIKSGALRDVIALIRAASSDAGVASTMMAFTNQDPSSSDPHSPFDIATLLESPQQVQGDLTGTIGVQLNPQTHAIHAKVGLQGNQWQVGPFGIDQFRLDNGSLSPHSMTVADVQLTGLSYGEMRAPDMVLQASIDSFHQTGRLRVAQIPLETISQWINSPVQLGGELGVVAQWQQTGTLPNMAGSFSLENPSIGRLGTEAMHVGFNFENDVLQIGQWQVPGHPADLIATGRIPFRLPYMADLPNAPVRFVSQTEATDESSHRRQSSHALHANGADQLVVSLGLFQKSFSIAALDQLANTGEIPNGWDIYLDLADLEVEDIRSALTQEIALNLAMTDHLLNSPLGEQALEFVGRVVHTPSEHANVQALRSALVFSTYDDGKVSLLEVLKNYPHNEIHVNLDELSEVMKGL
jgi:translocation and assembly module TamB